MKIICDSENQKKQFISIIDIFSCTKQLVPVNEDVCDKYDCDE